MTTIVNNPPSSNNSSGPLAMIILIVFLIVLAYLGVVYGLPAVQKMQSGGVQVTVPDKVDINVKQTY